MRLSLSNGLLSTSPGIFPSCCFFSVVSLNFLLLFLFFNQTVLEPYMDEEFHIPQAQRFCSSFLPSFYHPSISTPPGLYWFSSSLLRLLSFLSLAVDKEETGGVSRRKKSFSSSSCLLPFSSGSSFSPSQTLHERTDSEEDEEEEEKRNKKTKEEEEERNEEDFSWLRLLGRDERRRKKISRGRSLSFNRLAGFDLQGEDERQRDQEEEEEEEEERERKEEEEDDEELPWMCCSAMSFRGVNSLVISPLILFLLWRLLLVLHPGLKKRRRRRRREQRKITRKDGVSTGPLERECKRFSSSSSLHPNLSFSLSSTRSPLHQKKSDRNIHKTSVVNEFQEEGKEEDEKREFVPEDLLSGAYITESCLREIDEVCVSPWNLQVSQKTEHDSVVKAVLPSASTLGCMYTSQLVKGGRRQYQEVRAAKETSDEEREEEKEEEEEEKTERRDQEKEGENTDVDASGIESLLVSLRVLRISFFPLLYFFNFLFYTDVLAVFFLLLAYSQLLTSKHLWGFALAGIAALLVRQSSIIWLGGCLLLVFLSSIYFFSFLSSSSSSAASFSSSFIRKEHESNVSSFFSSVSSFLSPFFPYLPSQLGSKCETFSLRTSIKSSKFFISVCVLLPLLLPVIMFLLFVLMNGGRIAIGHQAFHQPGVHTAQLLYVSLFLIFASSPATLCRALRRSFWFLRVAFSSLLLKGRGTERNVFKPHRRIDSKDTSKMAAQEDREREEREEKEEEAGQGREAEMKIIRRKRLDKSPCQRETETMKEHQHEEEEEEKVKLGCSGCRHRISPDILERVESETPSQLPSSADPSPCVASMSEKHVDSSSSFSFYSTSRSFVLLFLFFSVCTGFGAAAHPFLLSDNRHYTFYLWRRFFRFCFFRFFLGPLIVTSFFVFGEVHRSLCIPPIPVFVLSLIKKEERGGDDDDPCSFHSQKAQSPSEARGRETERRQSGSTSKEEERSMDTIRTAASDATRPGEGSGRKESSGEKAGVVLIAAEQRKRERIEKEEVRERRSVVSKESRVCTDAAPAVMTRMSSTTEKRQKREKGASRENENREEWSSKPGNEKEREVDSWTLLSFANEKGGERDMRRRRRKRSEIVEIVEESEEPQEQGGVHTPEISGVHGGLVSTHLHPSCTTKSSSPSSISLGSASYLASHLVDRDNEEAGSSFLHFFSTESDLTGEIHNEVYCAFQPTTSGFPEKEPRKQEKGEESDRPAAHFLLLSSSSTVEREACSLDTFYAYGCLCVYTLCIVLVLVPADLLEPRYFLFILVLFLLHEKFLLSPEFYSSTPISVEDSSNAGRSGRDIRDGGGGGEIGRMKEQTARVFPSGFEGRRIHADDKEKREREMKGTQDWRTETSVNSYQCVRGNLCSGEDVQGQTPGVKEIVTKSWLQPLSCLFRCMYTRRAWVGVYRGEGSGYEAALLNEFLGFILNLVASFALIYIFVFHSFVDEEGQIARFMF